MNHSRRKGMTYERALYNYLNDLELDVEQLNRSGYDGADLSLHVGETEISIEAKNQKTMNLAGWIDQAARQAAAHEAPVVVHKRRGKTDPADHYVTMDLRTFLRVAAR